jgi:membrane protease YdiL (CAAX protease family)
MAPKPIKLKSLVSALCVVGATELVAGWGVNRLAIPPLFGLALLRLVQTGVILAIIIRQEPKKLGAVGWQPRQWLEGLKKGVAWSAGFALLTACAMAALALMGKTPLMLLRSPLPAARAELMLFFLTGVLIAPVAEELFFRGILYVYFRRWGVVMALAASTALFVVLHAHRGLPVTQIVGGLLFAIAYESSGNLMVPITIHALGNLAIFSLSLL